MKYLNTIKIQKLKDLGALLGMEFFKGQNCETEVFGFENYIKIISYNHNYSNKKDYEASSIAFSDFEITQNAVNGYTEEPTMKQKTLFLNFMIEEFKDEYKKDYIKFVLARNEKQNNKVDEPAK